MKIRGVCFKCNANITVLQVAGREEDADGEVRKVHWYCSKFWESQTESKNELMACNYCDKVVKRKEGFNPFEWNGNPDSNMFWCSWECCNEWNHNRTGKLICEMREIAC